MRREFYFQDDRSNKFWYIELDGDRCTAFNGRVGAQPRSTEKTFEKVTQRRAAISMRRSPANSKAATSKANHPTTPRTGPAWR